VNSTFEKFRKIKGLGFIIVALAAGVLLLLWPSSEKTVSSGGEFKYCSSDEYRRVLESDVEGIVNSVSGVDGCTVMITLKTGYEYYYATDQQLTGTESDSDSHKEYVLANYDGNEQPVLIQERMPAVSGVAVVCPGINATSEYKIIQMLSALFNLPTNRISVTR
jgi:stage III sporulation protein AG